MSYHPFSPTNFNAAVAVLEVNGHMNSDQAAVAHAAFVRGDRVPQLYEAFVGRIYNEGLQYQFIATALALAEGETESFSALPVRNAIMASLNRTLSRVMSPEIPLEEVTELSSTVSQATGNSWFSVIQELYMLFDSRVSSGFVHLIKRTLRGVLRTPAAMLQFLRHPIIRIWVKRASALGLLFLAVKALVHIVREYVQKRILASGPIGNNLLSKAIEWLTAHTAQVKCPEPRTVRTAFVSTLPVACSPQPNHTHGISAANRTSASHTMTAVSRSLGLVPYYVQMSKSDVQKGRLGSRSYFWAKDVDVPHIPYAPSDEVRCLVDVDMYIDMPTMLAESPGIYLIYTFQPSRAAASQDDTNGEYSYTFNGNEVEFRVTGGARYVHQVWNYGVDSILVTRRDTVGLFVDHIIYLTERKQMSPDHQLILLAPARRFRCPIFSLVPLLGHDSLVRLNVSRGNFTRLTVVSPGGLVVSTAVAGSHVAATLPKAVDDGLASQARISPINLTAAHVSRLDKDVAASAVPGLLEFHRQANPEPAPVVYALDSSVRRYQSTKHSQPDDAARPTMVAFMAPLVPDRCFAPDKCYGNDAQMISGRLTDIASTSELDLTPFLSEVMEEFATLLIPVPHEGVPLSLEEVYERQPRPSQRRLLDEALSSSEITTDDPIQSFQKAESYGKLTDPRIISTIPPVNKLQYARYLYAFSAVMKACCWYAFGKTPREVAERVAFITSRASVMLGTDLSRFDGRVAARARYFERVCMLRFFHPRFHAEMLALMDTQMWQKARTRFGVVYNTRWTRGSGSQETSDFNSLLNALFAFCCLRSTRHPETGLFYTAREAWELLGVYGGDDGLTGDVDEKTYRNACALFGQVLDAKVFVPGSNVQFLSRYYSPNAWHDPQSLDSMCDLLRTLSKFHTTVTLPHSVSPLDKLIEKSMSIVITDPQTPFIGPFCQAIIQRYGANDDRLAAYRPHLQSWWARMSEEESRFPNDNHENWMVDVVRDTMPTFDWLQALKVIDAIRDTYFDPLTCPILLDVPADSSPAFPCEMDGVVYSTHAGAMSRGVLKVPNPCKGKRYHPVYAVYGSDWLYVHEDGRLVTPVNATSQTYKEAVFGDRLLNGKYADPVDIAGIRRQGTYPFPDNVAKIDLFGLAISRKVANEIPDKLVLDMYEQLSRDTETVRLNASRAGDPSYGPGPTASASNGPTPTCSSRPEPEPAPVAAPALPSKTAQKAMVEAVTAAAKSSHAARGATSRGARGRGASKRGTKPRGRGNLDVEDNNPVYEYLWDVAANVVSGLWTTYQLYAVTQVVRHAPAFATGFRDEWRRLRAEPQALEVPMGLEMAHDLPAFEDEPEHAGILGGWPAQAGGLLQINEGEWVETDDQGRHWLHTWQGDDPITFLLPGDLAPAGGHFDIIVVPRDP